MTMGSSDGSTASPGEKTPTGLRERRRFFRFRTKEDDEPESWWFAATACPLLAATIAPLSNILSIAALVTYWRLDLDKGPHDYQGTPFRDPDWALALNGASLACGFVGNAFLTLNMSRRIPYLVALPASIIVWFAATALLLVAVIRIDQTAPPIRPQQTYSQGFYYGCISAVLYFICSLILMINMLGWLLGKYPSNFRLTSAQRTLLLQTMLFFFLLAGSAAVFARTNGWGYADSLYYANVTVLTIGFGDYYSQNDVSRGLVFPFSVIGIIMLGLMVGSIRNFAKELSQDKIIKGHAEKVRVMTIGRSINVSTDGRISIERSRFGVRRTSIQVHDEKTALEQTGRENKIQFDPEIETLQQLAARDGKVKTRKMTLTGVVTVPVDVIKRVASRKPKLLILKEEKDRFDAMREIQRETKVFKRYYNLTLSIIAFGILWCGGAAIFMLAEQKEQNLSYFQSLYLGYVSLLTIGYGDLAPKSNFGKPFFVVWSILAIPTMTILVSDLGDTLISSFVQWTHKIGDYTVLAQAGLWRSLLDKHPWLLLWTERWFHSQVRPKRAASIPRPPADAFSTETEESHEENGDDFHIPTLEELAEGDPDEHDLARKLAHAIRHVSNDLHHTPPKRFSYNEWADFTRLIRFTRFTPEEVENEEEEHGLIDWDWMGEDSPLLASQSEAEWVLDRLCESLDRYVRKQTQTVAAREKRKERSDFALEKAKGEARRRKNSSATATSSRKVRRRSSIEEIGPDEDVETIV